MEKEISQYRIIDMRDTEEMAKDVEPRYVLQSREKGRKDFKTIGTKESPTVEGLFDLVRKEMRPRERGLHSDPWLELVIPMSAEEAKAWRARFDRKGL